MYIQYCPLHKYCSVPRPTFELLQSTPPINIFCIWPWRMTATVHYFIMYDVTV